MTARDSLSLSLSLSLGLQVSIIAVEPCSLLLLNGDQLANVLDSNADVAFLLDCLIGICSAA